MAGRASGDSNVSGSMVGREKWLVVVIGVAAILLIGGGIPVAPVFGASPELEAHIAWIVVHEADSGSFVPDGKGNFILTLKEVKPHTIYFSQPPHTIGGSVPTDLFMNEFNQSLESPPIAAVVILDAAEHEDTLIVQLLDPLYDMKTNTLVYTAKIVSKYAGRKLKYHKNRRDASIPESFGRTSVFIDSGGICGDQEVLGNCYRGWHCCSSAYVSDYWCARIYYKMCWSWNPLNFGCQPCEGEVEKKCNNKHPKCCHKNQCEIDCKIASGCPPF